MIIAACVIAQGEEVVGTNGRVAADRGIELVVEMIVVCGGVTPI